MLAAGLYLLISLFLWSLYGLGNVGDVYAPSAKVPCHAGHLAGLQLRSGAPATRGETAHLRARASDYT